MLGVAVLTFSITNGSYLPLLLGCIILLVGHIFFLNLQLLVAYLLAFCIPISVGIPLFSGTVIQFPSELLIVVLGMTIVLRGVLTGAGFYYLKTFPLPAVWLAAQLVTTLFSTHMIISLKFWLVQCAYVLVFFYGTTALFLSSNRSEQRFTTFLWAYSFGVFCVLIYAVKVFYGYDRNPITRPGIFQPFFNDHTLIGASLALIAGAAVTFIQKNKWMLIVVFIAAFGIALGASRAAILGFLTIPLALAFFNWKKFRRASMVVFAVLSIFIFLKPLDLQQIDKGGKRNETNKRNLATHTASVVQYRSDYSNLERINRWVAALEMVKEKPFFGFGPGTYALEYIPYQKPAFETPLRVRNPESPPVGSGGSAHSEILLQLSESGVFVALVFVLILIAWIYQAFTLKSNSLARAAFVGLATYALHMHVNNFLDIDKFAAVFWFLGATIQAEYQRNKKEVGLEKVNER
jgi:putative inorganic carbon (HCO3(-)) transporter